jgi:hypothetical protein
MTIRLAFVRRSHSITLSAGVSDPMIDPTASSSERLGVLDPARKKTISALLTSSSSPRPGGISPATSSTSRPSSRSASSQSENERL